MDLALMGHDPTNLPAERMFAWEESAKLKAGERTERRYVGRTVPDEHVERVAFVVREGARIRADRLRHWPALNGKHPDGRAGASRMTQQRPTPSAPSSSESSTTLGSRSSAGELTAQGSRAFGLSTGITFRVSSRWHSRTERASAP